MRAFLRLEHAIGAITSTYSLSEPATIYISGGNDDDQPEVIGQGTLAECANIVSDLAPDRGKSASIHMDDLDLRFGPKEVIELLRILREESSGLSNAEIADIKDPDA